MEPTAILTCASLLLVDGDTVKCDGENLRPMGDGAPFVSGFDTPELPRYADCKEEIELGLRAALRMMELLETPGLVIEDSGELDEFERPLVWLRLPDGTTIGQRLIEEGLAVEWYPGYQDNFCE